MYKRAIIVGGGNSIPDDFNWDLLKNEFTFGINYIYKLFTPTSLVFDNTQFYDRFKRNKPEGIASYLISHNCRAKDVKWIPASKIWYGKHSLEKRRIYCGTLTGIYTLTLACCLPFEEIYLMGYDLNRTDEKVHLKQLKHPNESLLAYHQSHRFKYFKTFNHIFNVSPQSAIEVFPKLNYDEFKTILAKDTQQINQEKAREWLKKQL